MSADNGVYILATRGRRTQHGYKTEYRVAPAQSIGNFCWMPDYPSVPLEEPVMNREWVLRLFGEALVFTDRKLAEAYALAIYESLGYVEYGIKHLDFTMVRFPVGASRSRRYDEALQEALSI